ncbi:MoCo/4Fe-4S cofactor protein with predicted Tat translocation signal [Constrictibacter sp. MBR-5]|jgi:molybdopterin-containing oxidoreductase family iron-sulfur binding subunit|uniref:TAT-variant-translocated molybdopterin oxidoreductase n=1 Tax=Constrictibacter sp. MBR-5 TaxID=3156467 RepID=UPI003394CE69
MTRPRDIAPGGVATQAADAVPGRTGRSFWRSLEELADEPSFRARLEAEFPALAPVMHDVDRRTILKMMGASLTLAGLAGCGSESDEQALPYVNAPESLTVGKPTWYATAVTLNGYAQPVLGKTYAGRPVKLEGNPDHPASLGASDAFTQASLLGLYDPQRSQAPLRMGRPATWGAYDRAAAEMVAANDATGGEGFRLLTGHVTSPTLLRQIGAMRQRWPKAVWHAFEPFDEASRDAALRTLYGRPLAAHYRLDRAQVVVCLDDDLLGPGPRQTLHGRLWAERRHAFQRGHGKSHLMVAESVPSGTGATASERLVAGPRRIAILMQALASAVGTGAASAPAGSAPQGSPPAGLAPAERRWLATATALLQAHRGRCLVTLGVHHDAALHAACIRANQALDNVGQTLSFTDPVGASRGAEPAGLYDLADDAAAGRVHTLAMLDVDPVATAPADIDFGDLMQRIGLRLHAGLHAGATGRLSHWHLPLQHELETWSDARAVDGRASIIQPLVRPFYEVRSRHAILGGWTGRDMPERLLVQETWRAEWGLAFDARWRDALVRGFVEGSEAVGLHVPAPAPPAPPAAGGISVADSPPAGGESGGFDLLFRPDPTIWDGRFHTNAWLQELPKPISKIVWGTALFIAPETAAQLRLTTGDEVRLTAGGRSLTGPIWVNPGQAPRTVAATFGYGRSANADDMGGPTDFPTTGYDAFRLRTRTAPWRLSGVEIEATGRHLKIATTQPNHAMDGYDFVRTVKRGEAVHDGAEPREQPSFYPEKNWDSPSWGMSIDLDTCIGCNACVTACQAENNIPVVGPDLVAMGREMHWLRIDQYYEGDPADPAMHFQPVPCMHCENAPCEMGCPVNAAVHSSDGLNLQVYNRCIGTRTCSSFCPYKVRHFNWFDYTGGDSPPLKAVRNPDVTVRMRGVMEKCTYCVQRISAARIEAKKEGRPIRDGEVRTACQQACPTSAIVFGDVLDPDTAVSRRKADGRDYALLQEVNTRPRTTYLARIEPEDGGS